MRIYANEECYVSKDKELIEDIQVVLEMEDSQLKDITEQSIKDRIRSVLGKNNILVLALNKDKTNALILEFEKERDGKFYATHYDDELKNYYIEVK